MSIYNGLLYNDDIDITPGLIKPNMGNIFSPISDQSSPYKRDPYEPIEPSIIPPDVIDSIVRTPDGWTKDNRTEAGTGGDTYTDTPPTEKNPNPSQRTKRIYKFTQIIINNYSQAYLQSLATAGATFYVVYTDGTRDQVSISEIVDPHPSIESTSIIETEQIAKAINQHFWNDTSGIHVTDTEQDDWFDAVDDNFSDWPENPYYNILINSMGVLLRTQLINLSAWSRSGITFFDGDGNQANNIVSSFGKNGSLLRAGGRDVMRVTPNGVSFIPLEGNEVSITSITSDIDGLNTALAEYEAANDAAIAALQAQIDGVVDTYYEEVDPTYSGELTDSSGNNVTDSSSNNIDTFSITPWQYDWKTETDFKSHEGDLYYNIDTGHAWRWLKVDNVWQWYRIADSDVAEALEEARKANTLAGTKKRVFTSTPYVPYDVGDIWVTGSQVKYATVAKTTGDLYDVNDWAITATDDAVANAAVEELNRVKTSYANIESQLNTIITTNYVTHAEYEQNNSTWSAALSGVLTTSKQYADGKISQEVTDRNAAISASATAISQSVSETYQLKGSYATTTDLSNEVTNRNAAINTRANSILSEVSETYATKETLGVYVTQTSRDITTIIGDLSTIDYTIRDSNLRQEQLQEQIDSTNKIWYLTIDPFSEETLTDSSGNNITDSSSNTVDIYSMSSNNPAFNWTTSEERQHHLDDLYINTTTRHMWKYTYSSGLYVWSYIKDTDTETALTNASNAQTAANNAQEAANNASSAATQAREASQQATTLAGSKRRTFTVTPTPPYDTGDMWVDGSKVRYAIRSKSANQTYAAADWSITATDDTNLNVYKAEVATFIRNLSSGVLVAKVNSTIGTLQGTSNFKIVGLTWSNGEPTIGPTYTLIGGNGLSIYDNAGSDELAFFGIQNTLPYARVGSTSKGNIVFAVNQSGYGYVDVKHGNNVMVHFGYASGDAETEGTTAMAPFYTFGSRSPSEESPGNYSFVSGFYNLATGYASYAEGYHVQSFGRYSHGEGSYVQASGNGSHAEGIHTTASAIGAHAEGNYTTASGGYSHAEGAQNGLSPRRYLTTEASGEGSHAEGCGTRATGMGAHSEGVDTSAADRGHAEGYQTTAYLCSHAEGLYTKAGTSGSNVLSGAHAEGSNTQATGYRAHAEGLYTKATGYNSHAEGSYTEASGTNSHASGGDTIAAYDYQFVLGRYNSNSSSNAFEIGNGTGSSARSNAFYVTKTGTAYAGSSQLSSDKRVKTHLSYLDTQDSITFIKSLNPAMFEKFGRTEMGFYAQDVEMLELGKLLVSETENYGYSNFKNLDYNGIIAPLVRVIQYLLSKVGD